MSATPPLDYAGLYRVLAESAPDAIVTIDERRVILSANPGAERLFGRPAAKLVGTSLDRFMPERLRDEQVSAITRYVAGDARSVSRSVTRLFIRTSDGREVPVEVSFGEFSTDGHRLFSGIIRDVSGRLEVESRLAQLNEQLRGQTTELEQQMEEAQSLGEELEESNDQLLASNAAAQQALREARASEARYRALVEAGSRMVWRVDAAGRALQADFWTELTGRPLADHEGWTSAIHPDDRERVLRAWAGVMTSRETFDVEYRLELRSGAYRWFHVRAAPVYDEQRVLTEWIGTMSPVDLGPLRARRLLALAAGLSQAATPEAVAKAIFVEGLGALGADAGSLAIVNEQDGVPVGFELVLATGYGEEMVQRYRHSPLRPERPLTRAILTRRPVLVPSAADLQASFPAAAGEMVASGFPAFAVVPVVHGDHVLAGLNFSFRSPQAFDDGTRTYLETVGELCAQALLRARLFESEREARVRSEHIVRAIRDGFVAMDRDLRYTYVNPAAEAMLGRPADDMLGRTPWEVAPGTEGSPFITAYRASLADQQPRSVELPSVMTGTWLEAHIHPAPDSLTIIFQDVTERRLTQRDTEFMADAGRVLGSSLDYAATLDTLVRTAVPTLGDWCAVELAQESPEEHWPPRLHRVALQNADPARTAVGLELAERFPPTWAEGELMTRVLRYGETAFIPVITDEMIVAGARSPEHLDLVRRSEIVSVLIVPLSARGRTLGALTLCMAESGRHYTARDRALAEELGRRAGLAVDNARLYRVAEQTRLEAERANQAKSDLLAKVSHETRQPVHATIGWIDTLDLGIYGTLSTEQHDALRRIKQNQERLLSLLNDLLDMARVEAGKLELRLGRVPLLGVLDAVEGAVLPQLRAKSLQYESASRDPALALHADPDRLAGILTNLLSNAIKFTPAGGRVTLDCRADGTRIRLSVADSGIGIPVELHERVFEPFFQVDSGFTRTTSGAGLGLAISREAARAMGGDIALESREGGGSTFIVTLPRWTGD